MGCGQQAVNVDPSQVLAAASAQMKQLAGLHFVYEVHQPEGVDKQNGIVSITGDVGPNGDMQATVKIYASGFLVNADFIAVGDTHYIRYPLSLSWTAVSATESPVGTLNLATGTIQVLDRITDTEYVGVENRAGAKCYHITGTVAAAEVRAIAGSTDTTSPFPTDVWVGVEDDRVYEVDIKGSAQPSEPAGVWRVILLTAMDTAPDIKVPQ